MAEEALRFALNFVEDKTIPGSNISGVGALTGDWLWTLFTIALLVCVMAVGTLFVMKRRQVLVCGKHFNNEASNKNGKMFKLVSIFVILLCSIGLIFSVTSLANAENNPTSPGETQKLNATIEADGTISIDSVALKGRDGHGIQLKSVTTKYADGISVTDNANWTVKVNDIEVYNDKIPSKSTPEKSFHNENTLSVSVDGLLVDTARSFIGKGDIIYFDINTSQLELCDTPEFSADLKYNGSEQNVDNPAYWKGYDSTKFKIEGQTKATDAGTYQVTFTPTTQCAWKDGSRDPKTVEWSILPATMSINVVGNYDTVPYNGKEQSVEGYTSSSVSTLFDSSKLKYSGIANATGTNVGTYLMNLDKSKFSYNDANIAVSEYNITDGYLTIDKATAGLKLTPDSLELTAGETGTSAVTKDTDATPTVSSSDDTVATASLSADNETVTVTAVSQGTATITVSCKETDNYKAGEATIAVTVKGKVAKPTAIDAVYDAQSHLGVAAGTGYTLDKTDPMPSGCKAPETIDPAVGAKSTNAGTYAVTATLAQGFEWDDGGTNPEKLTYTISRADAKVTTEPAKKSTYFFRLSSGTCNCWCWNRRRLHVFLRPRTSRGKRCLIFRYSKSNRCWRL